MQNKQNQGFGDLYYGGSEKEEPGLPLRGKNVVYSTKRLKIKKNNWKKWILLFMPLLLLIIWEI